MEINFYPNGETVKVRPAQFLGGQTFSIYQQAVKQAEGTFDWKTKLNLIPVRQEAFLRTRLEELGFVVKVTVPAQRRPANTPEEQYMIDGLTLVCSHDRDFARDRNYVGFSGADTEFGHSIVSQYSKKKSLTEKQWQFVAKFAHKYREQIKQYIMERATKSML